MAKRQHKQVLETTSDTQEIRLPGKRIKEPGRAAGQKQFLPEFMDKMIESMKKDKNLQEKFRPMLVKREIPAKTILLHEGVVANNVFIILQGCLRQWFNKDGKDITFQFFFENQPVASIDSFMNNQPSMFTIESIEPSVILTISRDDFRHLNEIYPEFREGFRNFIFQRFRNYSSLFLSRIRDTPKERYDELIKNHPEIIRRVPQHYIASYLGITPVSLSRIRNRK